MKYEEAKSVIRSLASSQGFYGRLLRDIEEFIKEEKKAFTKFVKPLKSKVDLILAIEC